MKDFGFFGNYPLNITDENENLSVWNKVVSDIMVANNLTTTTNGAVVPISTGDVLIDQFGRAGSFRGRDFKAVSEDMEKLWASNPENALKFTFYLRMITRAIKLTKDKTTEKLQKGQGSRDESFKRLLWIAKTHPEIFYKNIWLLPLIGSWKDIWTLMVMARDLDINLENKVMFALMAVGLKEETQKDLILKFMPRIKTTSNLKTDRSFSLTTLAKSFADYLGLSSRQYNKMKSTGAAHLFQRQICDQDYEALKWGSIPGIALGILTSGKFLSNHELVDNYMEWLEKQGTVKFNGYPYDLFKRLCKGRSAYYLLGYGRGYGMETVPVVVRKTVDLQFKDLIDKIEAEGKWNENVLCALDTSGSMASGWKGVAPIDVCLSLGIYFSTLNKGHFHKKVMTFDSHSEVVQLAGSFTEMVSQIKRDAMGGTNFESIIDSLLTYRRTHPNVPLNEFPTTLLVVSDMQFNEFEINPKSRYAWAERKVLSKETVYKKMREKLLTVFPKEFVDSMKFIWWNVNGEHENQPATLRDGNMYFFSGMDGAVVSMVLGTDEEKKPEKEKVTKTMEEVATEALNQEILRYVTL